MIIKPMRELNHYRAELGSKQPQQTRKGATNRNDKKKKQAMLTKKN